MSEKLDKLLAAQESLKETDDRIAAVGELVKGVQEGTVLRMYSTFNQLFPVGPIPLDQVKLRENDKTALAEGLAAVIERLGHERARKIEAIERMMK